HRRAALGYRVRGAFEPGDALARLGQLRRVAVDPQLLARDLGLRRFELFAQLGADAALAAQLFLQVGHDGLGDLALRRFAVQGLRALLRGHDAPLLARRPLRQGATPLPEGRGAVAQDRATPSAAPTPIRPPTVAVCLVREASTGRFMSRTSRSLFASNMVARRMATVGWAALLLLLAVDLRAIAISPIGPGLDAGQSPCPSPRGYGVWDS